jgi:hypothetical protein
MDQQIGVRMNFAWPSARQPVRTPSLATRATGCDSISLTLGGVFFLTAIFYVWTAGTSQSLTLHGGPTDRYNLLANAFLHFHLSIGRAPAALLHLRNIYNPAEYRPFGVGPTDATSIRDDVLYHGYLYFLWGAAPAIVLLIPLHLLGFEPSASVTVSVFAIAGLGFALATLRILIRQIGNSSLWMCGIAGFAVAFSSAIPFVLRTPSITEDTLSGGYCFTMAGIWLAISAIATRRASLGRLTLMSLCFGLAAGSRPALGLTALVLVPVYTSLRPNRSSRELLMTLACPIGACFLLLLAYNQARFHQPLEFGARYQLTAYDSHTAPLDHLSYVLPGVWPYIASIPRLSIIFPFILLIPPQVSSPVGLASPEMTGGLLPMAPIVVFLAALPWLWRRHPTRLGPLASPLIILACAGVIIMLIPAYQVFASTERYEVEFSTLFVLGGLAAWLAMSTGPLRRRRQLVRVVGGLLVAWGCLMGLAISFVGYGNFLAVEHPGTWSTLENIGSPLSTAIATMVGHPVLASLTARNSNLPSPSYDTSLGASEIVFSLGVDEPATFTIISPDRRRAVLVADIDQRHQIDPAYPVVGVRIDGPGDAAHNYSLPAEGGEVSIPIQLDRGLNDIALSPAFTTTQTNVPLLALTVANPYLTAGN